MGLHKQYLKRKSPELMKAEKVHAHFRSLVTKIVSEEKLLNLSDNWQIIEELLKQDEFNFLLKHINGFVLIFNYKTGYYEYFSDGIQSSLGYKPQTLTGEAGINAVYNMIYPQQRDAFISVIMRDVLEYLSNHASPETGMDYRYNCTLKLGNIYNEFFWFILDTVVLQTEDSGFPMRTMVTCTNIDQYKKDEALYYNVLKKDTDGIYQTVFQKSITVVSEEEKLSDRELKVLELIGKGFTNQQVANQLFISLNTVQTHRKNILKKTDCKGTAELTKLAFARGLL
jgi:DNA-binding NarL/FixJ family response regulator